MRSWLTAEEFFGLNMALVLAEVKGYDTVMSVMKSVPHTPGHVAAEVRKTLGCCRQGEGEVQGCPFKTSAPSLSQNYS